MMAAASLSVLLVEDVPDNANLAALVFERAGFAVTVVRTGQDGLDAIGQGEFDVVALDLRLPDMDGLEVARRMRQDPRLDNAPIIAITALAMKGDKERALEAGCDAYITKPVDTRTLAAEVERIVQEYRARKATGQ